MADEPQKPPTPPPTAEQQAAPAPPPPPPATPNPAATAGPGAEAEQPPAPPSPPTPAAAAAPDPVPAAPPAAPPTPSPTPPPVTPVSSRPAPPPEPRAAEIPAEPAAPAPANVPQAFPSAPLESPLTDAEERQTLRKIEQHTTPFGRIVFALMAVGVLVTIGLWYWQHNTTEELQARLDQIGSMQDVNQVKASLRELLPQVPDSNDDIKWRIIKNIGHFKDAAAVPLLIKQLDDGGQVRRAAAWALAQIGPPAANAAKAKLLEVLPKTDEKDRSQVVWTLALLHARQASDAILDQFSKGMLQNLDGFDPKVIADVLGPEQLASDKLINHPNESVRVLTAHALAESNDPKAIAPLSRLLRSEMKRPEGKRSSEVIRAAAAGLGRIGDPRAAAPLFEALQKLPKQRQAILNALRQSTGAKDLALLVKQSQTPDIKRELVQLLADTHDPASADTLASLLDSTDTEMRNTAAYALADLHDKRAMPVILELARSKDSGTQDKAFARLRFVAGPDDLDALAQLMKDVPYRKADILKAMAATGSQAAARYIEPELKGDDAPTAARALAELDYEPAYKKLEKMVPRPKNIDMGASDPSERKMTNEDLLRNRKAAIIAMGVYAKPDAADELMKVVEDPLDDYELRSLAAQSLGEIGTLDVIKPVVHKMADNSLDANVRRYYVQALWQKPIPALSGELMSLMEDKQAPVSVRRAAALAVGYIGSADNDARLMQMLDDPDTARYAAISITLGGTQKSARKLLTVLGKNKDVRDILQGNLMNDENDWFNVLTEDMFKSGEIWKRLQVADTLKSADQKTSFSYAWAKVTNVLQSGWDAPNGVSSKEAQDKLYAALTGPDADLRHLVARALMDMGDRGLLLRARDAGGPGGDAARQILLQRQGK